MSASPSRFVAGVPALLLVLLVAVVLAGCGGSGSLSSATAPSQASTPSAGSTSTATESAAGTSKATSTSHPSHAPQQSTTGSASKSTPNASPPPSGRLLRRYAGSGNASLGTIVVGSRALLVWKAQRPAIQVFTAKGFILVNSHASSGSVQLSRGTYTGMRVATRGGWSIELRTRS